MNINPRNRDIWRNLFKAAETLRDMKPWESVREVEVFGVKDPVSGEIMYCSVLGHI